ncbi:UTP--glucose-1-phosphate uridylyltransferase [Paenibacillus cellulosilyticus]|uniref:UTP--glucose-1-phosphate uridylyltransferase n=1 Tax=Paenibacillus cellulosilyticus TaxID=375489 RepID=A0A2V2YSU7_9BACL|nr:sugar phosphate nucleotidyltransferase [Paenibacillus cellulosilyticus]PWW00992.1 UTP--glucose-1-phosphate uridylyltransferase [Paenibacillus cellulosilyticus]QKS47631.1 NTP transferase domain-containing protein [Paenibacillus cellulosilyticus]
MVKQAVILAAGLGTRLHPITKVIPKPMLPIGTKPILDFVVEELEQSQIEDIIMVVGHKRELIQEYYKNNPKVRFVVQDQINGTGPALYLTKGLLRHEPFGICYADDIFQYTIPVMKQLIEQYQSLGARLVTGVEEVSRAELQIYNSLSLKSIKQDLFELHQIIEKPQDDYPSSYTSTGRFIATHELFDEIEQLRSDEGKEIYLTEAINRLILRGNAYGVAYAGKRWDTGTKENWIKAINVLS